MSLIVGSARIDENGNLKKSAVRWNPYAEDLIADDWELAE